jgi:hypothetical protein
MKMTRYYFTIALMYGLSVASAQNRIVYHVNDEIKEQTLAAIQKLVEGNDQVFAVWATDGDTTNILIAKRDKGSELEFLIANSNRILQLQTLDVPIIFKSDLFFSEQAMKTVIGKNGKPRIKTTIFTISGYVVRIKGHYANMKWIDTSYFQF